MNERFSQCGVMCVFFLVDGRVLYCVYCNLMALTLFIVLINGSQRTRLLFIYNATQQRQSMPHVQSPVTFVDHPLSANSLKKFTFHSIYLTTINIMRFAVFPCRRTAFAFISFLFVLFIFIKSQKNFIKMLKRANLNFSLQQFGKILQIHENA